MTGEGGVCVTSKAAYGRCLSFKNCYPYIKKIPNLSIYDTWVLGNYDTCTFLTTDGRQAFGVCCDDPSKPINPMELEEDDNDILTVSQGPYANNWPPPLPTHPPNHAAPTHPTRPIATQSTTKRPVWPPPVPTHPPSQGSGATVADGPVGNFCGAKNGLQDQERIVGGQNASPNEWPWIAVLFNNG